MTCDQFAEELALHHDQVQVDPQGDGSYEVIALDHPTGQSSEPYHGLSATCIFLFGVDGTVTRIV